MPYAQDDSAAPTGCGCPRALLRSLKFKVSTNGARPVPTFARDTALWQLAGDNDGTGYFTDWQLEPFEVSTPAHAPDGPRSNGVAPRSSGTLAVFPEQTLLSGDRGAHTNKDLDSPLRAC